MDDASGDQLLTTVKKLREEGASWVEAFGLAKLDMRIKDWPQHWGDDVQASIYGDLEIETDVNLPVLGITIKADKVMPKGEAGFVFRAPYCYTATVQVSSKDKEGVLEAVNRLEKFLAAWRTTDWGGSGINYWCHFFNGDGRVMSCLDSGKLDGIRKALSTIARYTDHQQRLIWRAAWWLRQCRRSIFVDPNPSVFGEYLAYWNALECLTEAVCDRRNPPETLTKLEKDKAIQEYEAKHQTLTSGDIDKLYNEVVNPGLPRLIRHALTVCFGVVGEQYYAECFTRKPKYSRLYQVRNDIAHGNIVEYDLNARLRVETAQGRLWMIVNNMLALLAGQAIAFDREVSSCYTCLNLSLDNTCGLRLLPSGESVWRFTCGKYEPKKPN